LKAYLKAEFCFLNKHQRDKKLAGLKRLFTGLRIFHRQLADAFYNHNRGPTEASAAKTITLLHEIETIFPMMSKLAELVRQRALGYSRRQLRELEWIGCDWQMIEGLPIPLLLRSMDVGKPWHAAAEPGMFQGVYFCYGGEAGGHPDWTSLRDLLLEEYGAVEAAWTDDSGGYYSTVLGLGGSAEPRAVFHLTAGQIGFLCRSTALNALEKGLHQGLRDKLEAVYQYMEGEEDSKPAETEEAPTEQDEDLREIESSSMLPWKEE